MMLFALGLIAGLLIATLVVVTLTFFRRVIEKRIEIIQKQIEAKGPKPKGFIVEPPSQADDVREHVIEENRGKGLDTPIEDLR